MPTMIQEERLDASDTVTLTISQPDDFVPCPPEEASQRHSAARPLEFMETGFHDIRGSLFVSAEFSLLLAEEMYGVLSPDQKRVLQIIHDRTYDVHDILESVHASMQLKEGTFQLMPRPCSVQEILDLAIPRLLRRAYRNADEIRSRIHGTPARMNCDPDVASLILLNLFCHLSAQLDIKTCVTLQVEENQEAACNVFRFVPADGIVPENFRMSTPRKPDGERLTEVRTYSELAVALADEIDCTVLSADPQQSQLAGLAIPSISTRRSSKD